VEGKSKLKFHGTIESIDLTKKILKISGRTVAVDAQTEIENGKAKITLADLKTGETVKVTGTLQSDASVLARQIKVLAPEEEAADEDENEAEFVGKIKSLAADTKSLEVTRGSETVTVKTDAHTAFERSEVRIGFADLHVNDLVKVEGTRQSATVVLASEIEVLPPERIEFKGAITDVNTAKHTLKVGDHTVVVGPETKCEGQVHSCDALQKGDFVEVSGALSSDGTVQAHEINKTAPRP
jgi:hypothetical protein